MLENAVVVDSACPHGDRFQEFIMNFPLLVVPYGQRFSQVHFPICPRRSTTLPIDGPLSYTRDFKRRGRLSSAKGGPRLERGSLQCASKRCYMLGSSLPLPHGSIRSARSFSTYRQYDIEGYYPSIFSINYRSTHLPP